MGTVPSDMPHTTFSDGYSRGPSLDATGMNQGLYPFILRWRRHLPLQLVLSVALEPPTALGDAVFTPALSTHRTIFLVSQISEAKS